jgi:hypothetical protein
VDPVPDPLPLWLKDILEQYPAKYMCAMTIKGHSSIILKTAMAFKGKKELLEESFLSGMMWCTNSEAYTKLKGLGCFEGTQHILCNITTI